LQQLLNDTVHIFDGIGEMVKVVRSLFMVREVWFQIPSRSNLLHVANETPSLQPWCVGSGAKPRSWAPLTRDTGKGLSEYNKDLIFW